MGDRGNIAVQHGLLKDGSPARIYLYTHWKGSSIKETLQRALRKRQRWDDSPYLTRIIFNELQGKNRGEAGFGISPFLDDNENNILIVNPEVQKVTLEDENGSVLKCWSFEKFTTTEGENS